MRWGGCPISCVGCWEQRERWPVTSLPPLASWLRTRTPTPPDALLARIDAFVAGQREAPTSAESLIDCAASAMTTLLGSGCLTRQSALDLLAVDALITYAFEAAADEPDRIDERARRALTTIAALAEPYSA